jgi:hypothetical protein
VILCGVTERCSKLAVPINPLVECVFHLLLSALSIEPRAPSILLRHLRDRWRFRVLDLEPMRRAPGTVGRAEPLRHDALAGELTGVRENNFAVAFIYILFARPFVMESLNHNREPLLILSVGVCP